MDAAGIEQRILELGSRLLRSDSASLLTGRMAAMRIDDRMMKTCLMTLTETRASGQWAGSAIQVQ